jgi:exodeoxyribonuclease VII small subunit
MATKKPTYSELSARLDELLSKLQNPDCDVDDAVAYYEAALQCIAELEKHLQTAKNRITKVQADFTGSTAVASNEE